MAVGTDIDVIAYPVAGVRLAAVASGIRYPDRLDLVLLELAADSAVAGVFTRNAFCAAPVVVAKQHLARTRSRFLLVNTGNANAGTGAAGEKAAQVCCERVAELSGLDADTVLPFSTGVIGEPLPMEPILNGLPKAFEQLAEDNWQAAALGIMTTDTRPKLASTRITLGGKQVTITGMAKGAGMLKPNMATMLAFICTDAGLAQDALTRALGEAVSQSFNRITVDGDTSTNDACMLVATGRSGIQVGSLEASEQEQFNTALQDIFRQLAQELIRDAEGATKFITIRVEQGANSQECLQVAYTIAESPLVKTAFFASDANWGRILAAIGRAGIAGLELNAVRLYLGDVALVSNGGRDPDYNESKGQAEMSRDEITITVELGRGEASETVWTCDLSHDYVSINADYRT